MVLKISIIIWLAVFLLILEIRDYDCLWEEVVLFLLWPIIFPIFLLIWICLITKELIEYGYRGLRKFWSRRIIKEEKV